MSIKDYSKQHASDRLYRNIHTYLINGPQHSKYWRKNTHSIVSTCIKFLHNCNSHISTICMVTTKRLNCWIRHYLFIIYWHIGKRTITLRMMAALPRHERNLTKRLDERFIYMLSIFTYISPTINNFFVINQPKIYERISRFELSENKH